MTLNEGTLYDTYRAALEQDNEEPFTDFTQNDRDAYMRLKFKALRGIKEEITFQPDGTPIEEMKLQMQELKSNLSKVEIKAARIDVLSRKQEGAFAIIQRDL